MPPGAGGGATGAGAAGPGRAARDAAELPIAMGGGCRARVPPAALRLLVTHAMLLCAAGSAAAAGTGTRGRAAGEDPEAVPGRGGSRYRECGTGSARGARSAGGRRGQGLRDGGEGVERSGPPALSLAVVSGQDRDHCPCWCPARGEVVAVGCGRCRKGPF